MSLKEMYGKKFKAMYDALEKKLESGNTFTSKSFKKYEPLFQKESREIVDSFMFSSDPDEKEALAEKIRELDELTDEFYKRIDPFRNIKIVDEDGELILELPTNFFNTKAIEDDEDNTVAANVNLSGLEPKHRDGAFNRMLETWSDNQMDEKNLKKILDARKEYNESQKQFDALYGKTNTDADVTNEESGDSDDGWEIV